MNVLLYARVSTDRQADLSIPAQLEAMRAYAHQRNWRVAEEFIEPGASAKTTERPALQRLLTRVRNTKLKTDVVLVHKIDRLARNVYDHATIKALLTQREVQLASVVENVDDSVPGQLVENIMASIAQFYSANLSEEVKKGMRQKLMRGGWPHLPPRGYVSVKNADGRGSHVEIQPTLGPLVTKAFELYATGNYGLRTLSSRLAQDGLVSKSGRPLTLSEIRRLLSNPFYTGRVVSRGLDLPGTHRALLSNDLFQRVQNVLRQRHRDTRSKGRIEGFVLRGIAICASCRGRMTCERHDKWRYYRCSRQSYKKELCAARFCNATVAHAEVERVCRQVQLQRPVVAAIRRAADQLMDKRATSSHHLASFRQEQQRLTRGEIELAEKFARGDLTPAAFERRAVWIRHQRSRIEGEFNRPIVPPDQVKARLEQALRLASSLWDLYQPLDETRRNALLAAVFSTVVIGPIGILGFTLRPPFDQLHRGNPVEVGTVTTHLVEALQAI